MMTFMRKFPDIVKNYNTIFIFSKYAGTCLGSNIENPIIKSYHKIQDDKNQKQITYR